MTQAVLSIRMDAEVKEAFAAFCDEAGLNVSTAVNLFARQTLRQRRIPFPISLEPEAEAVLPLREIKSAVCDAAALFPAISKVVLFGSYARGEANAESDIDLRIVYDQDSDFSMMRLAAFSHEVEEATAKQVDVVSSRTIAKADLARAIEEEGLVVYERKE